MNIKGLPWIIVFALLVMAVNVAVSVLYMFVYGYLINPGQPEQHYHEYVRTAAPYSSIIAGMPLFYLAGRWLTRRWEAGFRVKAALLIWLVYALIDLAVLGASGFSRRLAIFALISLATKFVAAYLGGVAASRKE